MTLIETQGYTVSTVTAASFINGANGQTHFGDRTVLIRDNMDDAAMVKTLLHEAGHVLLHDPNADPAAATMSRSLMEVEAESVAFVVARVHGMDTDGYSFPYIAGWAGAEDPHKVISKTAQRIAKVSHQLIEASPAEHTPGGKASIAFPSPAPTVEPAVVAELAGVTA